MKKVKKWGNSWIIIFDAEDREIHDIQEGDMLDLEIFNPTSKNRGKA